MRSKDEFSHRAAGIWATQVIITLLEIEVLDLKTGLEAVEERARSELGMIGSDETFVLVIE